MSPRVGTMIIQSDHDDVIFVIETDVEVSKELDAKSVLVLRVRDRFNANEAMLWYESSILIHLDWYIIEVTTWSYDYARVLDEELNWLQLTLHQFKTALRGLQLASLGPRGFTAFIPYRAVLLLHQVVEVVEVRLHDLHRAVAAVDEGHLQVDVVLQSIDLLRNVETIVLHVIDRDGPVALTHIAEVVQAVLAVGELGVLDLAEDNRVVAVLVVERNQLVLDHARVME